MLIIIIQEAEIVTSTFDTSAFNLCIITIQHIWVHMKHQVSTLVCENLVFYYRECHALTFLSSKMQELVPTLSLCVLQHSIIDWNLTNFNDFHVIKLMSARFIYLSLDGCKLVCAATDKAEQ